MVKPILPRQVLLSPTVDTVQATHPANSAAVAPGTPLVGPEPVQPRKRGRKPGPLSRSAREAQRKLNHSIIEKARRTKINDALATLRQLVPSDFSRRPSLGHPPSQHPNANSDDEIEDEDDKDDDDGDAEYPDPSSMSTGKKPATSGAAKGGKKREEKEFKLEVLERTVSYLQDLAQRYDEMRMRHDQLVEMNGGKLLAHCRCSSERRRYREYKDEGHGSTASRKRSRSDAGNVIADSDHTLTPNIRGDPTDERPSKRHSPLPPISSWMPLSPNTIRSPLSPAPTKTYSEGSSSSTVTPLLSSQLPTPPSSTLFQPFYAGSHGHAHSTIPSLSLGPTALPLPSQSHARRPTISLSPSVTPRIISDSRSTKPGSKYDGIKRFSPSHRERALATVTSPTSPHTPEDENAASLLLTMRLQHSPTSPSARSPITRFKEHRSPVLSGRGPLASPPTPSVSSLILPPPDMAYRANRRPQVETPGSLLGLTSPRK